MGDKAKERKSHVKRVYKTVTNPETQEKETDTDTFVDVLRIDEMLIRFKSQQQDQKNLQLKYVFKWNDDKKNPVDRIDDSKADKQYENANAKRKTKKLVIRDPDVKKADQDGDFYLWILNKVKTLVRMKESGHTNQLIQFVFNNKNPKGEVSDSEEGGEQDKGKPAKDRKTTILKIKNNDLGGMKMRASESEDDEDGPQSRIVDWDTYMEALKNGKEDEEDTFALNVEFTDKFTVRFKVDEILLGFENQLIQHVLQNKDIEDLYKAGDEDVKDADGKTALLRTDPLQNIVNVGSNIIAVEFKPEDT